MFSGCIGGFAGGARGEGYSHRVRGGRFYFQGMIGILTADVRQEPQHNITSLTPVSVANRQISAAGCNRHYLADIVTINTLRSNILLLTNPDLTSPERPLRTASFPDRFIRGVRTGAEADSIAGNTSVKKSTGFFLRKASAGPGEFPRRILGSRHSPSLVGGRTPPPARRS